MNRRTKVNNFFQKFSNFFTSLKYNTHQIMNPEVIYFLLFIFINLLLWKINLSMQSTVLILAQCHSPPPTVKRVFSYNYNRHIHQIVTSVSETALTNFTS